MLETASYADRRLYLRSRLSGIGYNSDQMDAVEVVLAGETRTSLDSGAMQDPGSIYGGIGFLQWTNVRRRAIEEFARQQDKPWYDFTLQIQMLIEELSGKRGGWVPKYKRIFEKSPDAGVDYLTRVLLVGFVRPAKVFKVKFSIVHDVNAPQVFAVAKHRKKVWKRIRPDSLADLRHTSQNPVFPLETGIIKKEQARVASGRKKNAKPAVVQPTTRVVVAQGQRLLNTINTRGVIAVDGLWGPKTATAAKHMALDSFEEFVAFAERGEDAVRRTLAMTIASARNDKGAVII